VVKVSNLIVDSILLSLLLLAVFESVLVSSLAVSDSVLDPVVDLNYDGKVDIVDVFIVARAFGSKPGDSKWNPDANIDNDSVITIMDIVIVALSFGRVFPRGGTSIVGDLGSLKLTATAVSDNVIVLNLTYNGKGAGGSYWKRRVEFCTPGDTGVGVLPSGLALIDGDLVWDGYDNVTTVSIQVKAEVIVDGEWVVYGSAARADDWDQPGAIESFSSEALGILFSNGSVIDVRKWEPTSPPTHPRIELRGQGINGSLDVTLGTNQENLTIWVHNGVALNEPYSPQGTIFFDDSMYGLRIDRVVDGGWVAYRVLGESGTTSLEPWQFYELQLRADTFGEGFYQVSSIGWIEQDGRKIYMEAHQQFEVLP
jgi:hypothetical protein